MVFHFSVYMLDANAYFSGNLHVHNATLKLPKYETGSGVDGLLYEDMWLDASVKI